MQWLLGLVRERPLCSFAETDGYFLSVFCHAGSSLHVCMTPHGPDTATFESGTKKDSAKPERLPSDSLAFMFEVGHQTG